MESEIKAGQLWRHKDTGATARITRVIRSGAEMTVAAEVVGTGQCVVHKQDFFLLWFAPVPKKADVQMGDIWREKAAVLASEMLTELGYTFDGQCWSAPANQPLKSPPRCMQYDVDTIDEKFRRLMGSQHTDLAEPRAALRYIGLAENTITTVLNHLYRAGLGSDVTSGVNAALLTLQSLGFTWKGGEMWTPPLGMAPPFKAADLLDRAGQHMKDRAATYDKPEGERSMAATVAAFNAQTGRDLTESEGWLLMVNLKIVRDRQRERPHRDSIEDLVAYGALYGEARLGGAA